MYTLCLRNTYFLVCEAASARPFHERIDGTKMQMNLGQVYVLLFIPSVKLFEK